MIFNGIELNDIQMDKIIAEQNLEEGDSVFIAWERVPYKVAKKYQNEGVPMDILLSYNAVLSKKEIEKQVKK